MKKLLFVCALLLVPRAALADTPLEIESSTIPTRVSVGIGVGWNVGEYFGNGNASAAPNTGSLRFRFASGLAIEPTASVQAARSDWSRGEITSRVMGLTTRLRMPVARRRSVEISLLGAGYAYASEFDAGQDVATDGSYSLGLQWGLGIEWFVTSTFSVGFDADSRVIDYSSNNFDESSISVGPFLVPKFRAMATLYY